MATVETPDFVAFARRVMRSAGARVADGELDELKDLADLRGELDEALATAVAGLRGEPHAYSWQAIADVLGVSKQAAMKRWPNAGGARRPGGQPGHRR